MLRQLGATSPSPTIHSTDAPRAPASCFLCCSLDCARLPRIGLWCPCASPPGAVSQGKPSCPAPAERLSGRPCPQAGPPGPFPLTPVPGQSATLLVWNHTRPLGSPEAPSEPVPGSGCSCPRLAFFGQSWPFNVETSARAQAAQVRQARRHQTGRRRTVGWLGWCRPARALSGDVSGSGLGEGELADPGATLPLSFWTRQPGLPAGRV